MWYNDTLSGDVYEGQWKDGSAHGQGERVFSGGSVYSTRGSGTTATNTDRAKMTTATAACTMGQWKDGYMRWQGIYTYSNGNKYDGAFQTTEGRHRQGTWWYSPGLTYDGALGCDASCKFVGSFKSGYKHGEFKGYDVDGNPTREARCEDD